MGSCSPVPFGIDVGAVAVASTVTFFADRVKTALSRQANLLLGADLLVSGDRPLAPSFAAEAEAHGAALALGREVVGIESARTGYRVIAQSASGERESLYLS